MENMSNKTRSVPSKQQRSRKIRGAYISPRNSAAKRSRSKRGTCDNPGDRPARSKWAGLRKRYLSAHLFLIVTLALAIVLSVGLITRGSVGWPEVRSFAGLVLLFLALMGSVGIFLQNLKSGLFDKNIEIIRAPLVVDHSNIRLEFERHDGSLAKYVKKQRCLAAMHMVDRYVEKGA